MSDNLSILPPDNDVFHKTGKQTSEKQKTHLQKAREKARETIERRKMLDKQAKEDEKPKDLEPVEEESEEEEEVIVKPKSRKQTKKVELTEEEVEARRFNKFMKQMKKFEEHKEMLMREEEEAKKIKLSLTNEEYEELVKLLDKEEELSNKKIALEQESPALPKKVEQGEPITSVHRALRPRPVRGRFGK